MGGGGTIIPSVRNYAFPFQNFYPPTKWAVTRFRWICPIFWILVQEDKNFLLFSFLWMLIRPKHTFVIGCTSLLFPFDFHLYLVTACYARVDPHAVIPNARAFPPYLCSLASFWDLQFSCPGAGAFLLKSHTIILEPLFGFVLKLCY